MYQNLKEKLNTGITWKIVLFLISLLGLPIFIYLSLQVHAEDESLRLAKSFSSVISTVRSYYANNVASNVLNSHSQVVLTENYRNTPGGIPIPATLSIELGELLKQKTDDSSFMFSFVSDLPFLRRDRLALDNFQDEALRKFRQDPRAEEHWAVQERSGLPPVMRHAIPVRMEQSCIACHNSHPDSPLKNWKVGDVRGIQDVQVSLSIGDQTKSSAFAGIILLFFITSGILALKESMKANKNLKTLYEEKIYSEEELKLRKDQLEKNILELSIKTTVIEKAPFGIAIASLNKSELIIDYANENFLQSTGYDLNQLAGKPYRIFEGEGTDKLALEKISKAIVEKRNIEIELPIYISNGSILWSRCLFFPTFNSTGVFQNFIICHTDINELKKSEYEKNMLAGELHESLKLESLGLTIAGIAHDLNTPIGISITAITYLDSCLQSLQFELERNNKESLLEVIADINESTSLIKSNLDKAANLVKSFKQTSLDASRNEWHEINIQSFFESLLVAISPITKRANCLIQFKCPSSIYFYTEPGLLSQAVTNIIINATIHAFPNEQNNKIIDILITHTEAEVQICISDNGVGMQGDVLAKLFTPFFTTKRTSGGTGLGLFSSKRLIEENFKGKLTCNSRVNQGTTFVISIPIQRIASNKIDDNQL